jgi:hexosaminidase
MTMVSRKARSIGAVAFAGLLTGAAAQAQAEQPLSLIPAPESLTVRQGTTVIAEGTPIVVRQGDADAQAAAVFLSQLAKRSRGLTLPVRHSAAGPHIAMTTAPQGKVDAYALETSAKGATITAHGRGGLLYGAVTLWQLLTSTEGKGPASFPRVSIKDAPRFAWRGVMLDSARHYQSPELITQLIDWMALHKLNMLQWHLVDDQGWRLEIKAYPKLTSVGAWRTAVPGEDALGHGKAGRYGGFYSQDEVRRIVAYAAARNVTIVPEIEMPGHSTAAIAAYPELGLGVPPTEPANTWGVHTQLFNARPATFTFLETVLREVMQLFPSTYIHIGGDEAVKDRWKASSEIQAQMKAEGVASEQAFQSWFVRRIEKFISANGRRLIGWDEILEGGLPPNATVMSWRGVDGAITAAKSGHDAVISPRNPMYFNYRQSDAEGEPAGRAPLNTLADVYTFEPAPRQLGEAERRHIIGVQSNLWTEHIATQDHLQYMLFPRFSALAEIAWSDPSRRDFGDFVQRLQPQLGRYRTMGVRISYSAFEPAAKLAPAGGAKARVSLGNQANFGTIRYELGGRQPTVRSPVYSAPLDIATPTTLSAATFDGARQLGAVRTTTVDQAAITRRTSTQLAPCEGILQDAVGRDDVSAARESFVARHVDQCWLYPRASLDGVTGLRITMTRIRNNFSVPDAALAVMKRPADGKPALLVRLDGCKSPVATRVPLTDVSSTGMTPFSLRFPKQAGAHDVCVSVEQPAPDPIYALGAITFSYGEQ